MRLGVEPRSSHALYDADHLQGVAAQLEEVVVNAHALESENFTPDAGEDLFVCRLRCDILGAKQVRWLGSRQGVSVNLGVGSERQRIECHERARHHIRCQIPRNVLPQVGERHFAIA